MQARCARQRLRTADGPVTLIDTHLHARHSSDVPHAYRPHRTAQIVQLASAATRIDDPIVALGDFNFDEGQDEGSLLRPEITYMDTPSRSATFECASTASFLHGNGHRKLPTWWG